MGKLLGFFFSDHENFYDGRLFGEVSSEASVHLEDGVMTAAIHAPEETYYIEVIQVILVNNTRLFPVLIHRSYEVRIYVWDLFNESCVLSSFKG
jgi:hypothetical protein